MYDEDDALNDLSGWTARMEIKSVTDRLLVSPTTTPIANGDVPTLGGAAGTVRIFVSLIPRTHSTSSKASTASGWSIR